MPDLLLFAPCERVIIEEGSDAVSLISVMQELRATNLPDPLSSDAVVHQRWFVVTIWRRSVHDEGLRFEQQVTLNGPDGKVFFDVRTAFDMSRSFHRSVGEVGTFPIAAPGEYLLRLGLRGVGQHEFQDITRYPIALVHLPADRKPG